MESPTPPHGERLPGAVISGHGAQARASLRSAPAGFIRAVPHPCQNERVLADMDGHWGDVCRRGDLDRSRWQRCPNKPDKEGVAGAGYNLVAATSQGLHVGAPKLALSASTLAAASVA